MVTAYAKSAGAADATAAGIWVVSHVIPGGP
jgi:hypothetical protein